MAKFPERFKVKKYTLEETTEMLLQSLTKLCTFNPELEIIHTVSPVPAHALFSSDNVIVDSFAGKCMLWTVAEKILAALPSKVFYFPSFDITLGYNPFSYTVDNRHVHLSTKKRIFKVLEKII